MQKLTLIIKDESLLDAIHTTSSWLNTEATSDHPVKVKAAYSETAPAEIIVKLYYEDDVNMAPVQEEANKWFANDLRLDDPADTVEWHAGSLLFWTVS